MSTDGVLGASCLPTDGYLDPSQLTYALAEGAREGGCAIHTHTRVTGIDVARRARARRADRARATSRPRSSSTPAACTRPRSGGWPACACRSCRWRTSTSSPSRSASATRQHLPDAARPRPARLLPRGGRRAGDGRLRAPLARRGRCDDGGLDAIPPDFNGRLLEEDWDRFEEIVVNARMRVPAMEDVHGHAADQRAGGVHARQRVLPRRDRRARASSSPPASARTGWPARAAIGKVMAEWIAERRAGAGPVADGHPALRRALPLARATRSRARARSTRPTTTSSTRATSARPGGRCASRRAYDWHARARRGVRREVGLGAGQLVRGQRGGGRRGAAPARLGRACTGRRRSAPSTRACREARRAVRRVLVRQDRGRGPGRRRAARAAVRQPRRARASGKITYTQMLNRRGGIECDFTVTRLAEDRFSIVTGTAFGTPRPRLDRAATRGDGVLRASDVTSRWACFGLWGPRARDILAPLHARPARLPAT